MNAISPAARLAGGAVLEQEHSGHSRRAYAALVALIEDLAGARWKNDSFRSGRIRSNIDRVASSHLVSQGDREWVRSIVAAHLDALPDEPTWQTDPFDVPGIEVLERRDLRPSELDVLRMIEAKAAEGELEPADHRDLAELVAIADGTSDERYARRVFDAIEPAVRQRVNRRNERLAASIDAAGEPLDRGTLDGFATIASRFLEDDAETLDGHIPPNLQDDTEARRNVANNMARNVVNTTAQERFLAVPNDVAAPAFDRLGPAPVEAQEEAVERGQTRAAAMASEGVVTERSPMERLAAPK